MTPSISSQFSAQLGASSRVAFILWSALMMSVVVYGGAAFMITSQGDAEAAGFPMPPFVLPLVAVIAATTGAVLYRHFTSPDRIRALLQAAQPPSDTQEQQALPARERQLSRVPALVLTATILRWALFESVAIFGLVLAISDLSFEAFVPYGVAAIALMAMTPPRLKQLTLSAIPLLPSQ